MTELEELRKQLESCASPQKQMVLMAKIKKLEKDLGIKAPQPEKHTEDRLSSWNQNKPQEKNMEPKAQGKTGLSPA